MHLHGVIAALVFATLDAAPPLQAATEPATCAAVKRRAVGKKVFDKMKCQATAARRGGLDPRCLEKAEERFSGAFARAEQEGGCLAIGDGAALEAEVDAFVADAVAALPVGGPTTTTTTTTTTTIPGPCSGGGQQVAGPFGPHCWYEGGSGASCDQVCAAVGRAYDPATATFAGSDGSDTNCLVVLAALNPLFPLDFINSLFSSGDCASTGGLGCVFKHAEPLGGPGYFRRCATPPTAGADSYPLYQRACACQ